MTQSELAMSVFESQKQCRNVVKISMPVLNITAVQTVIFMRFEMPDRLHILSTHPSWVDHLYKNKAWLQCSYIQKMIHNMSGEGFLCQMQQDDSSPWASLLQTQQIKQSVLLGKRVDEYYCLWFYGTFNDSISNKADLIDQIDSLKIFSNNFYKLAAPMMRAIYPYACFINQKLLSVADESGCLTEFIKETPIHFFSIMYQQQPRYLTYNQALCLYHLSGGMTAKEIAREVGLSPRTVEKHFDNLKLSFKVSCRKDLVDIFKQSREFWL